MVFDDNHLLAVARAHGDDSGSEYEAGDLQQFLRAAWEGLTPEQHAAFYRSDLATTAYEGATGSKPLAVEGDVQHLPDIAETHGDDAGAESEVGDLQEFIRAARGVMTVEQKSAFFMSDLVEMTYEGASGSTPMEAFNTNPFNEPAPATPAPKRRKPR